MTTAQTEQSQEARDLVVAEFDRTKGNLAETPHNLNLMQQALVNYHRKHGSFVSVALLRAVVESLRPQLDWLATPAPATVTPKLRGSFSDKLYQLGVPVSPYMSHADKQDAERAKADTYQHIRDDRALLKARQQLHQNLNDAHNLTIMLSGGPHSGKPNWAATQDARRLAVKSATEAIQRWNTEHPDQKIEI